MQDEIKEKITYIDENTEIGRFGKGPDLVIITPFKLAHIDEFPEIEPFVEMLDWVNDTAEEIKPHWQFTLAQRQYSVEQKLKRSAFNE